MNPTARFNACLDVVIKSWTSKDRFSYHGKYWNFADIVVEPPTAQKPHPPMWMAAGSQNSIRQVAERGYNLLLDQKGRVIAKRLGLDVVIDKLFITEARIDVGPTAARSGAAE